MGENGKRNFGGSHDSAERKKDISKKLVAQAKRMDPINNFSPLEREIRKLLNLPCIFKLLIIFDTNLIADY